MAILLTKADRKSQKLSAIIKVKVSYNLIAVRGFTVSWAKLMKGGTHTSPFAALSFLIRNRYTFTAGLTEFSSCPMAKPSLKLTNFRRLFAR